MTFSLFDAALLSVKFLRTHDDEKNPKNITSSHKPNVAFCYIISYNSMVKSAYFDFKKNLDNHLWMEWIKFQVFVALFVPVSEVCLSVFVAAPP